MKNKFLLIPISIFLLLMSFFFIGLHHDPHELPSVLVGKSINKILDEKGFNHHITLLNIWASWCAPCRLEHQVLLQIAADQSLKQQYGLQMIGINYKDDKRAADELLSHLGNPYKKTIDDPHGQKAMNLGVYGTPETFIIDQKSIIRYRFVGPITTEVWQQKLLPMIKKIKGSVA